MEYYEQAFKRLDETGKCTWNWAAFFGVNLWMFYRKMYLYGMVVSFVYYSLHAIIWGIVSVMIETDHFGLMCAIEISLTVLLMVFLGYFGNAMYYRSVKNRIRKGYHLLEKYCPTSIPSALVFGAPFVCLADWISRKLQLKTELEIKVCEESVHDYLNPNRKIHWVVQSANILCFALFLIVCNFLRYHIAALLFLITLIIKGGSPC